MEEEAILENVARYSYALTGLGPMVHTLQRYKMATSVFAGCGLFAVPAIGFITQTQAPMGLVCGMDDIGEGRA